MKLLLDTHIFLWALLEPERIDDETVELLESAETELYLSAVSGWEVAIKHANGSLLLPESPQAFLSSSMAAAGVRELPLSLQDAISVADLPPHHNDPIDRFLIAQARTNQMYIVTDDRAFADYDVKLIDC